MEALIGALVTGVTGLIGFLLWYVRQRAQQRIEQDAKRFDKIHSEQTHGERMVFDAHLKAGIDRVRELFNAPVVFLAKFHNGDNFSDGAHIWKWSSVIESSANEQDSVKKFLQNRSTADSPKFFGDLKGDGIAYSDDINQCKCDGMRMLLKSVKATGFISAMHLHEKGDVQAFAMVLYNTKPSKGEENELKELVNEDRAKLLKQELNTFANFI